VHELILRQMGVPDGQRAHLREPGHRLPIGGHRGERGRPRVGLGEAVVAGGDREARRHPLHVPLKRPRQCLVEIVQVEQQPPLGRGEDPEVRQVRVATELHLEASDGGAGEVGRHDLGSPAVEGER
jgi:hypothetical protein